MISQKFVRSVLDDKKKLLRSVLDVKEFARHQ
jgi:hypothetical protein